MASQRNVAFKAHRPTRACSCKDQTLSANAGLSHDATIAAPWGVCQ